MRFSLRFARCVIGGLAGMWVAIAPPAWGQPNLVPVPALGLRIQRGFRISLYAGSDLANDISAMTLDAAGNVVVAGPGYIKVLRDTDGNGAADTFTVYATAPKEITGMCFDGPALYVSDLDGVSRYEDLDANGVADGPPEQLFPLGGGEHGAHGIRKGPDGYLYLIAGNDSQFDAKTVTLPGSPVRNMEGGALMRIGPNGTGSQVIADGFYNPYDFDFDLAGDIFTCDGTIEADFALPWFMPGRLYHIAYGQHHGWRLKGATRSWARPPYYADTPGILADMGQGEPTGVVCYRHRQFPPHYQGGLFVLDWAFGDIWYAALEPVGATYASQPEVFLEPLGARGFAPSDVAVAPNGSLYVSLGGHHTQGAVFRIDYAGPPLLQPVILPSLSPGAQRGSSSAATARGLVASQLGSKGATSRCATVPPPRDG